MKKYLLTFALTLAALLPVNAKTLIAYYSFTNHIRAIVNDLSSQIPDADVVEIEPAEEGIDYAANGYAVGDALIEAINAAPNDATSYPEIKEINVNFDDYNAVIVAVPLWWSHMAAPMQTFLFHNGAKMAGKKIGLIVSSASSGISGVVADAKRLIPNGNFTESLWIRSAQTSACHSMIAEWISRTGFDATDGVISVDAESEYDTTVVHNTTGNRIMSSTTPISDFTSLAPGMYVVRTYNHNKGDKSTKIIVK